MEGERGRWRGQVSVGWFEQQRNDAVHYALRFFSPTSDYPKVGVICQRILGAAAEVVVRVYPKELSGVDPSTPIVAIDVPDSFFASRLGDNLDEPGRKLTRTALVLAHDQVQRGTPGCRQAAVCMESIRFVVSSLLVLL